MFLNVVCCYKYYHLFCFGKCPASWVKKTEIFRNWIFRSSGWLLLIWPLYKGLDTVTLKKGQSLLGPPAVLKMGAEKNVHVFTLIVPYFCPILTQILRIGQIVVKCPYINCCNDWFGVVVLNLFHAWMLTYLCVLCMHKYWWSCSFRACVLGKQLAVCMRNDGTNFFASTPTERLVQCTHSDGATCFVHAYWRSDVFYTCLMKERVVLCMLIEGATSFIHAYWRSDLFCACLLKERLVLCVFIEGATCFMHAYWKSDLFPASLMKERLALCMLIEGATLTGPANYSRKLIVTSLCHVLHSNTFGVPSVNAKVSRIFAKLVPHKLPVWCISLHKTGNG